jgi:hypothetical protein
MNRRGRNWLGYALAGAALFTASACGGGEVPEAKTADSEDGPRHGAAKKELETSSEIGALDEAKVSAAFRSLQGTFQRCLKAGSERNEFEGGDIAFFVKIDKSGRAFHAHAEKSTIGDRQTEKCMLDSLKKKSWPEPQGGDVGLARSSFGSDPPNDVRPPTAWEQGDVREALAEVSSDLESCKRGASGEMTATVYVDPDGAALSAGFAASDESGEEAADCVVKVLKDAKYPSPGSWPAKVTLTL